jgi:hypothetical protein
VFAFFVPITIIIYITPEQKTRKLSAGAILNLDFGRLRSPIRTHTRLKNLSDGAEKQVKADEIADVLSEIRA